jgi:uncharacterized RDD family membrane protein YckC
LGFISENELIYYKMETKIKSNIGKRFLAGLIDYTIIFSLTFVFVYSFGEPNQDGGYSVTGILSLVPFFFWFTFTILFESLLGSTFGNSITGLRPKSLTSNSRELSFGQSVKRHLLDPFDMFPFGIIGIITIKNTEKHQRLGDIWAKTIVIEVQKK